MQFAKDAAADGVELWGSMALVDWSSTPFASQPHEPPAFFEQAALTAFEPTDGYGYVRLQNATLRAKVTSALQESIKELPSLKGILLEGNMPYFPFLAYSDASRMDGLAKLGVNPIDLNEPTDVLTTHPPSQVNLDLIQKWAELVATESRESWRSLL